MYTHPVATVKLVKETDNMMIWLLCMELIIIVTSAIIKHPKSWGHFLGDNLHLNSLGHRTGAQRCKALF